MIKYILIALVALVLPAALSAQQEALNSQYVMNKLVINPAYAGYKELPNMVITQRNQWVGFKGAPITSVIAYDSPMKKKGLAMGATFVFDKIGPTSTTALSIDFAYRMRLSNRATLAFGMKGTLGLYQNNLTDLNLISTYYGQTDDYFSYNTKGVFLPNVGFGVYYYKKDHYIGLSVPKMIRNKLEKRGTNAWEMLNGRQEPTIHLMAGKIIKINKQFKLQPNFILRGVWGAPMSIGLYTNLIYMDRITTGLYYYIGESVGLMFQWQLDKRWKLGYAFDVPTSRLITTNLGSHELSASYILSTKKKRIIYPRYF